MSELDIHMPSGYKTCQSGLMCCQLPQTPITLQQTLKASQTDEAPPSDACRDLPDPVTAEPKRVIVSAFRNLFDLSLPRAWSRFFLSRIVGCHILGTQPRQPTQLSRDPCLIRTGRLATARGPIWLRTLFMWKPCSMSLAMSYQKDRQSSQCSRLSY